MKLFVVLALVLASAVAHPTYEKIAPFSDTLETIDGPEGRITNGQTASNGQFPYQVALNIQKGNAGVFCGGSLIDNKWVITAAHCMDGASSVTVNMGSINRNAPKARVTVQRSAIKIHPQWNSASLTNDITLIQIPAVSTNNDIKPIRLAGSGTAYTGSDVTISGWGKTSDTAGLPDTLKYAKRQVISNDQCSKTFKITKSHVCIGTSGGVSTCNGDSGGPMVLDYNKTLLGITSFGAAAGCTKGYPAVFTRITQYHSWIKQVSGIN